MNVSWPSIALPKISLPGKDRVMQETLEAYHGLMERMDSFDRFTPSKAARASGGSHLRAMTYNVMLGGKDYPGILATLKQANPDVAGLQEVSRENAERLAKDLGMHVAFYGERKAPFQEPVGKAILSKYPLESAQHELMGQSKDHWEAIRRYAGNTGKSVKDSILRTELGSRRGVLAATFEAGGKKFAMLDTHLTLKDARLNGQQLDELRRRSREYRAQGYEVILVGDFNTNLALKGGETTDGKGFADPTDTVSEFKQRYGHPSAGNIADPDNMRSADALRSELQSAWESSGKRYSITAKDAELTPEEARELLAKGEAKPGSGEWKVLAAAADGVSHLGAAKRFDNILVSKDLRVKAAAIDMVSRASDHQAVIADLAW